MIKDKIGRRRYILFSVKGKVSRPELIRAINNQYQIAYCNDNVPWLTVFTGYKGIVRCRHSQQAGIINLLNSIVTETFSLTTSKTSGTIKKLKKEVIAQ
jgi:RNase P/RNase MRP subunit POP5